MNGDVSYSTSAIDGRYRFGTIASFTCSDGYIRNGLESSICRFSTSEWTDELPTCIGNNLNIVLCF